MNEEDTTFQQLKRKSSEFSEDSGNEDSMVSFRSVDQERTELDEEKKRIMELKKVIDDGRERLRKEMGDFESMKARYESGLAADGSGTGSVPGDKELEREREKLAREWREIDIEEKRLESERKKRDILFDDIASRKIILDKETKEVETEKAQLKHKAFELEEREKALATRKEEFRKEKSEWETKRTKQLEELRSLPDKKDELEMERTNLRLEKMRFEEEQKPLDDEKRYLEAKRKMMDQEQEILEQQRKLIEEQKKRLLESGTVSIEAKYALETPIPKPREPLIRSSTKADASPHSVFDVGQDDLYQTRYHEKEAQFEKIRRERLKSVGTKKKPLPKAIRPGKSVGKAIRVGKLPSGEIQQKVPTMTCISCNAEVRIPPGSTNVTCPKCGREYKIRGRVKAAHKSPGSGIGEKGTVAQEPAPSIVQPELKPDLERPTTANIVLSHDSSREKANIYEKLGNYYIHCLNPSCKAEIEISNPSMKRVHCLECGRRNRIAPLE